MIFRVLSNLHTRLSFSKDSGKIFKALIHKSPPGTPYNMTKSFTLNDGSRIPWLAFGTGTALYKQDAADHVRLAIENNITHLDGAQVYNNEDSLGAGIKASGKPRSELFIVTKLHSLQTGETIKESLKVSLAKLGLDYVDLFLIHSPYEARNEKKLSQWWEGMEEVKHAGLAKSIGVSNFYVEDLKVILETAKVVPSVNQVGLGFQFFFFLMSYLSTRSNSIRISTKLQRRPTNSVRSMASP